MTIETTLYDVAQLLESADGAAARVRRVLELLRVLVPYDQCALLEAGLGHEPRVVLVPETPLDEGARPLLANVAGPLRPARRHRARRRRLRRRAGGEHLAVPLVGLDEVIGLLFVRSSAGVHRAAPARAVGRRGDAGGLLHHAPRPRRAHPARPRARRSPSRRRGARTAPRTTSCSCSCARSRCRSTRSSPAGRSCAPRSTISPRGPTRSTSSNAPSRAQAARIEGILDRACVRGGASSRRADLPQPSEGPAADDRLAGIRVLLVEHDLGVREAIEAALEHHGAEVTAVGTAPEALAALDRRRPDVLLFGDLPTRGDSVDELMREVTARACPLPVASISTRGSTIAITRGRRASSFISPNRSGMEALVDAVAELAGLTPAKSRRKVERGSRS